MAIANINARRWTVEEYERAARTGLFRPEERLELIEGEIVEQMTPQLSRHATGVSLTQKELERAFAVGYAIRVQQPLDLSPFNQPEPDMAVVSGAIRDFA